MIVNIMEYGAGHHFRITSAVVYHGGSLENN
jgi:hypothetical protein